MTQSTSEFVKTEFSKSRSWLEGYYKTKLKDGEAIQVCAGEYRPDPNDPEKYYFWDDPDWRD